MNKEKLFFSALQDIFIGAKVEGESGFVNLMRIKSRYYEQGVFPRLKEDIDKALEPFPEFREELFDRLYTFFRRYFSESGSIYFRFTPPHEHVYEKVYTDDRDVALFWKTHMLYYVKTDRLFRNMAVEVDGFKFFFDVSSLEHKRANEKRSLVYDFKERREDGTLVFTVTYSERGRQTNIEAIRRAIKTALGLKKYTPQVPSEETLQRAFRLFERQSEVDYFINKDARKFLREQFNLWLYQYIFEPEERKGTVWIEKRIRQLQVLKEIAYKIIDFIAQFEDELVKIWNKPKFVLGSHYVITLDRIAAREGGMEVLERLLSHSGMEAQVQEWRELGMVDEDFTPKQVWIEKGKRLHERYQYLPIDTKYFPDLEMVILSLFDHLDQELDGWLVHSENYQALNTMLPKFRERVKCIYIDPPYNSPETEIHYVNRFRDASWITLMENRLEKAKEWLQKQEVAVFVAVDDYEVINLGGLLAQKFSDFEINTFVVVHHPQGSPKNNVSRIHEYTFAIITQGTDLLRVPRPSGRSNIRPFMRTGTAINNFRVGRPNSFYAIVVDPSSERIVRIEDAPPSGTIYPTEPTSEGYLRIYPIDSQGRERVWRKTADTARKLMIEGKLFCRRTQKGFIIFEKATVDLIKPVSVWINSRYNAGTHGSSLLADLFGATNVFSYPKSIYAVQDFVASATYKEPEALILDFFAGSGTTAHAVINLNRKDGGKRKYILVEMADYFHTVLLPRIKKVVLSDKWKDGKAQPDGKGISHFVKYFRLEQYEDVLRKAHYQDDDAPLFFQDDPYAQYVFLRDPKMLDNAETGEKVMEVDMDKNEIRVNLSKLYPDIDLAETLSCLTGKWIRRIHPAKDDPTKPGTVEFEDGSTVDLQNPPWELVKPLIWW